MRSVLKDLLFTWSPPADVPSVLLRQRGQSEIFNTSAPSFASYVDGEKPKVRVPVDSFSCFLFPLPIVFSSDADKAKARPTPDVTASFVFALALGGAFSSFSDWQRRRTDGDEANAPQVPAAPPPPFVFSSLFDLPRKDSSRSDTLGFVPPYFVTLPPSVFTSSDSARTSKRISETSSFVGASTSVFSSLSDMARALVREGSFAFASPTSSPTPFALFAERLSARKVLGSEALFFPFAPTGVVFFSPFDVRRALRALGIEEFNTPQVPPPPATPFVFADVVDILKKAQRREGGEFNTPQTQAPPPVPPVTRDGGPSGGQFPYTGAMPFYPNGPSPDMLLREIGERRADEDEWLREYIARQDYQVPENDVRSFTERLAITKRFSEIPQDVQLVAGFQRRERWKTVAAGALIGIGAVMVLSSLGER